jgi:hypothetical protein
MHAPNPTVLNNADAHRHELLALAARYRFIENTFQSVTPVSTATPRPHWKLALGYARYAVVSLATVAFGKPVLPGLPR